MWNWYEWDSIEAFDSWHTAKCVELNYPLDSYNQATGELDPEAAKTTAYTSTRKIEGKFIAQVEEAEADGLTLTALRPTIEINK